MMSCSFIGWLLPLTLGLSLGLPTQRPELFKSPPGPPRFLSKALELLQKYHTTTVNHAAKAHELALNYWNQKYNTTFCGAPGELTHIVMETKYGEIFHMKMNLVQVTCPKDKMVNLQNCAVVPGSPKFVCKLAVIVFSGHNKPYISEEGCQEAQAPSALQNDPAEANVPPYPDEKEGGGPYYV